MSVDLVELGEVAEIVMGQAPRGDTYNSEGKGWPLIAGASDFGVLYPQPKKFTTGKNLRLCEPGDVILGIRATIGEKVLADQVYCLGRGVAAIRPTRSLDPRYLWNWIGFSAHELSAKGRGATFKQVNKADVAHWKIPLPPIEDQRRIAAVLDSAEALRAKRHEALAKIDSLRQAAFVDMFGDAVSGDIEWPVECLADVVAEGTTVTYGIVQAGEEFPDGVPYIRTGDIVDGRIRIEGLRRTDPAIADKFPRSCVRAGEIVMSIRATVGTTAIVPAALDGSNLTQGTARISPGESVDGIYLLEHLRSDVSQRWIQRQVKGATFREITLGRLREMPVLVPPTRLQQEFAETCQEAGRLRSTFEESLNQLDLLFASLQQRAFRGEL